MKRVLFVMMVICATQYAQAQTAVQAASKTTVHSSKKEKKATRKSSAGINPLSKDNFTEDFKGISNVSWQKDDEFDVASFKMDNKKVQAYYDQNGILVGTITNTSSQNCCRFLKKRLKRNTKAIR